MITSTYLLIITFNVNELNAPIKRRKMTKWILKKNTHIHSAYKIFNSVVKTHRLKMWGFLKVFTYKYKQTENLGSNTYIRKNRL